MESGGGTSILYVIRDLVGNNSNTIADYMIYLVKKKSDQPEDGS